MYFSTSNLFLIETVDGEKAVKCSLSVFPWHMDFQWCRTCVEIDANDLRFLKMAGGGLQTESVVGKMTLAHP